MLKQTLFLIVLVSLVSQVLARARSGRIHHPTGDRLGDRHFLGQDHESQINRLHKALHIENNPLEDIRTNVLLNMEGF
jgi:hypothetical protein